MSGDMEVMLRVPAILEEMARSLRVDFARAMDGSICRPCLAGERSYREAGRWVHRGEMGAIVPCSRMDGDRA